MHGSPCAVNLFTIRKFYGIFSKIDSNRGGSISLDEFFSFFKGMGDSPFGRRLFSIFDVDHSGEIDFKEFVMSVWNACTSNNSEFARFGFRLVWLL